MAGSRGIRLTLIQILLAVALIGVILIVGVEFFGGRESAAPEPAGIVD